jgi:hypothetical protein
LLYAQFQNIAIYERDKKAMKASAKDGGNDDKMVKWKYD